MKTAFATLAVAAIGLFGMATQAEAGPRFPAPPNFGPFGPFGHMPHPGFVFGGGFQHHQPSGHCATPHLVRTCEINRYQECRTAYTQCGRPYTYHVTVVTYQEVYSNGATRIYTRTYS